MIGNEHGRFPALAFVSLKEFGDDFFIPDNWVTSCQPHESYCPGMADSNGNPTLRTIVIEK